MFRLHRRVGGQNMTDKIRTFYILFYIIVISAIFIATLVPGKPLYSQGNVVETFEAGPVKANEKKVAKVQTHFQWSSPNVCPCHGKSETGPCVRSFLNKDNPSTSTKFVNNYNEMVYVNDQYQGSGTVPGAIRLSSVRLIVVPFCKQCQEEKAKK